MTVVASDGVQSVTGPVGAEELGRVLMHEHVAVGVAGALLDSRVDARPDVVLERAAAVFSALRAQGVATVVDMTTIEMGRDPALLAEVSRASGVAIVCTSGFYTSAHGIPAYFRDMAEGELVDLFVREVAEGIGTSGVRAGVLKAACSSEPTEVELKVTRAVATAARETGVAVLTHTSGGGGDVQARLLLDGGVDPGRVVIGHVDHKDSSPRYLTRLARAGITLGFDRVGATAFLSDEMRAGVIAGLVADGLADRITLSMDTAVHWYGHAATASADGPVPFGHLLDSFVPLLERVGVGREVVEAMLRSTPARVLTGTAPHGSGG